MKLTDQEVQELVSWLESLGEHPSQEQIYEDNQTQLEIDHMYYRRDYYLPNHGNDRD